jgi:uncharacterized protein (DUF1697 family)
MPKYVAFLRAINVGNHTVKMTDLAELFHELGFTDVKTFIASGNVVFKTPSKKSATLEARIEKHLEKALGYEVPTFIRSIAQLNDVANHKPFPSYDPAKKQNTLMVGLLKSQPSSASQNKVLSLRTKGDDFQFQDDILFWLCPPRMMDSKVSMALLEKAVGIPATFRNVNTIQRIVTLHGA